MNGSIAAAGNDGIAACLDRVPGLLSSLSSGQRCGRLNLNLIASKYFYDPLYGSHEAIPPPSGERVVEQSGFSHADEAGL
jgi:hypothetical protein